MWSLTFLFVLMFFLFSVLFGSDHFALGKRLLFDMLLVHLFVYLTCVSFFIFSLPLGGRAFTRLVIVTLPGIFI